MRLRRLRINQLPGIAPGFELHDIGPGINLVTGPNAIGKSSLIRAIGYLVAPASRRDPLALSLEADFENDALLQASRNGTSLVWQQQGRVIEPPPLPDPESLHCYWLTMENLAAGDDDRLLVAQLQQALAGGYNLPALREALFRTQPKVGSAEASALHQAEKQHRDVEADYRILREKEQRLPTLQQQIEQARAARTRADQLWRALELLDGLRAQREVTIVLQDFPAQMTKLEGREGDRLNELDHKRAEKLSDQQAVKQLLAAAQQQLRDTGLASSRPQDRQLSAHKQRLQQAAHQQSELDTLRDRRQQVSADEAHALARLGGTTSAELTPQQVSEAEQFARQLQQAEKACDDISARLRDAGNAPDEHIIQRHNQALDSLNRWLAVPKHAGRGQLLVTVISTALLVALLAGFASSGAAISGGLVALLAVLASYLLGRDKERPAQQKAFAAAALDGPARWTAEAVAQRRDALQKALAELHGSRDRATVAEAAAGELRRKQVALQALQQRKQALAKELGFDPMLTAAGLDHFVRLVNDYQQAAGERQQLAQQINSVQTKIAEARNTVRGFLEQHGYQVELDGAELAATLDDLQRRSERAVEALRRCEQAERDSQRLDKALSELDQESEQIYRRAGFSPQQRRELEQALARLRDWHERQQQLRDLNGQIRQQCDVLADEHELIEQAQRGDRDALQADYQQAQQQSDQYEDLVGEHKELTAEVNRAGRDRQLEQAMAQVDSARSALEDRRDEQLFAEAGQFLLDDVEQEHRSEHEPAVLADARQRFEIFTHHAFSLELHHQTFAARDMQRNEWRALTELSSGTRMQLLLAVRLAWTRRLERRCEPLPIFLDEALTTSDEQRFQAVAQSLNTLAQDEGRQIFYLSARRHELALWEKLTGTRPQHIDLAEVRFGQVDSSADDYVVSSPATVPAPDGKTAEQYAAELGIPAVDRHAAAENIPLFYLLRDDLPLLHQLMQDWKIRTLGQLAALLQSDVASRAIADDGKRQRLADRCHSARHWLALWRRGRGKPVDRMVLETCGVKERYLDDMATVAAEVNGDAERLLDALQNKAVDGFGPKKIDELRESLLESGYIDRAEILDQPARERELLRLVGATIPPAEANEIAHWLEAAL